jgi:hypothetical protein
MTSIRVVPLDPPSATPRTISARLRSQLNYFSSPSDGPALGPDEFRFAPEEVAKWLEDGVFFLVSPLDSANVTEVELTEEQEDFLNWLRNQCVQHVRVIAP